MTQGRVWPTAQNCSNKAASEGQRGSADRKHALVHPVQPPRTYARVDCALPEAELTELQCV